ncbi:TPA: YkgJ family cysteine cluster protein [Burkholderia multivorans]|nr:YkgJ family cysteine cluster protein [Burkholderia multivorans]
MPTQHASAPRRTFPCTQCGACCRHIHLAEETRFLDRGDGACRHYDDVGKLCTIYEQRPAVCRVEQHYDQHFVHLCSWDKFVELNLTVCSKLAAMDRS